MTNPVTVEKFAVGQSVRRLEDPRGLLVIVGAEVGEEPGADLPRLADVENAARGGKHAIDTGAVLRERAHPDAQPLEVGGCECERGTARYCWHRWQKTVMRASISCVCARRVPHTLHFSPSRPYTKSSNWKLPFSPVPVR